MSDTDGLYPHACHLYDGLEEDWYAGEELFIPGPAGRLEAVTAYPSQPAAGRPIAVICHPHPLYGGSLANKVVHVLSDAFNAVGAATLRFNFRGVGRSEGAFDRGRGESEDLQSAVAWLRARHPDSPLWVAGFSFGAYVALRAQPRVGAQRLLLVAPPVTLFNFDALQAVDIPWMVIQGGRDEIITPQEVSAWVNRQANPPEYRWMADADHFFHGRLGRIRDVVIAAY